MWFVALRKESVDRNCVAGSLIGASILVALRKESVDRNSTALTTYSWRSVVALRKESVDRNPLVDGRRCTARTSLSARRAWIEISS